MWFSYTVHLHTDYSFCLLFLLVESGEETGIRDGFGQRTLQQLRQQIENLAVAHNSVSLLVCLIQPSIFLEFYEMVHVGSDENTGIKVL